MSRNTILIDRYCLIDKLGKGGMGEVFLASDSKHNDKIVAIKRMFGKSEKDRKRFYREYLFLSSVNHPNLIQAYNYFEYNTDVYMALEYVEGQPMNKILKSGKKKNLSLPEQLVIANKIARAIEILNTGGIIHRDIKPSNIIINIKTGVVKVLDLGVGKDLTKIEQSLLTEKNAVVGTSCYMSPEQANGETSPTSDIFSLGVTLYQFFSWQPQSPFVGDSQASTLWRLASFQPPKLDTIVKTQLPEEREIYSQLADLFATAMAKEPQERWQNSKIIADKCAELYCASRTTKQSGSNFMELSLVLDVDMLAMLKQLKVTTKNTTVSKKPKKITARNQRIAKKQTNTMWLWALPVILLVFFYLMANNSKSGEKKKSIKKNLPTKTSKSYKKTSSTQKKPDTLQKTFLPEPGRGIVLIDDRDLAKELKSLQIPSTTMENLSLTMQAKELDVLQLRQQGIAYPDFGFIFADEKNLWVPEGITYAQLEKNYLITTWHRKKGRPHSYFGARISIIDLQTLKYQNIVLVVPSDNKKYPVFEAMPPNAAGGAAYYLGLLYVTDQDIIRVFDLNNIFFAHPNNKASATGKCGIHSGKAYIWYKNKYILPQIYSYHVDYGAPSRHLSSLSLHNENGKTYLLTNNYIDSLRSQQGNNPGFQLWQLTKTGAIKELAYNSLDNPDNNLTRRAQGVVKIGKYLWLNEDVTLGKKRTKSVLKVLSGPPYKDELAMKYSWPPRSQDLTFWREKNELWGQNHRKTVYCIKLQNYPYRPK